MSNYRNAPALSCSDKCGKVCIEAKRIFDACLQKKSVENAQLTVVFPPPPCSVESILSITGKDPAIVSNLSVTPLPRSSCSRVKYTLTIPIEVIGVAGCTTKTGKAHYTLHQDVIMRVPASSPLSPVEIAATVNLVGLNGTISNNVLTCTLCIMVITKVAADVLISVPTYGYPCIPPCQDYNEDLCEEVFSRPIFPTANPICDQ